MLLAALAGAVLAWLGYRGRLTEPLARLAAFSRFVAVTALVLLLLDPGFLGRRLGSRPLVLLDHSLSTTGNGSQGAAMAALAATLGDTVAFGMISPGLASGNSGLAELLTNSLAAGRSVTIVTDGEIPDAGAIPADMLASVTVRTLARQVGPDIALTAVRAPDRLSSGDTLRVEVEATRTKDAPDSVNIELRDGQSVLAHGTAQFKHTDHAQLVMVVRLPASMRGDRWLDVAISGAHDSEPGDDVRWLRLIVTPSPGIIVLSTTPDWDGRTLYRTLKEIADAPVTGYVQMQTGRWHRMSDLHDVSTTEVMAAAHAADLLAVRGDIAPWRTVGHSRLLWAPAEEEGDWFLSGKTASPVGAAFQSAPDDSLPPAVSAHGVEVDAAAGWIGATARRSRRGADVPVVSGKDGATGRTVFFGVDGLYRWSIRGGATAQTWRTLLSASASWLLASPDADSSVARPVTAVTQHGRAVHFRWIGSGTPVAQEIHLEGPHGVKDDSLRFDGSGDAAVALDVGRYRYTLGAGGHGTFGVEPYADELVPHPVSLSNHDATATSSGPRRSWRELWWLFAIAVAGFGTEWLLRRKAGAL